MRTLAVLMLGFAALMLGFAGRALAQTDADDPRFRTFSYEAGSIYHIPTSPQAPQTVLFAPGEQIRTVFVSDPSAYQISVAAAGDSLTFRAAGSASLAAVSVRTDLREYQFELVPAIGPPSRVPQVVRFAPITTVTLAPALPAMPPVLLADVVYRFKGSDVLRPSSIGDDGSKTYISWRQDQPIPAVFAVGPAGNEEMVDGYFRAGRFTIDRVYDRLVFKLDREITRVERNMARQAR